HLSVRRQDFWRRSRNDSYCCLRWGLRIVSDFIGTDRQSYSSGARLTLSRRAVHYDFIAEQANLGVALDIDGFVFAQFGFGGDEQRAVVYVGRGGVAGEEDEIAPKAFGVGVAVQRRLHLPGGCMAKSARVKAHLVFCGAVRAAADLSRIK